MERQHVPRDHLERAPVAPPAPAPRPMPRRRVPPPDPVPTTTPAALIEATDMTSRIRRTTDPIGPAGGPVPSTSTRIIEAARGQGAPLPAPLRARMESGFGLSLADVRIHTDDRAGHVSRDLGAQAFTTGSDVFFGAGEFRPGSSSGLRLLAHELAHTVQQSAGARPVGRMTVRRTLDDATQYATRSAINGIVTKEDVARYVSDDANPLAHRKALLAEYDKGLGATDQLGLTIDDTVGSGASSALVVRDPHADADATASALFELILLTTDLAAVFLAKLPSKDLFAFASAGTITRKLAQRFAMTYLPMYDDRFQFNLATKGMLLITDPDVKYGGAASAGKPHATSGYKWYRAALTGTGPVVLGALEDYQPMRDYTTYMRDEKDANNVEATAKYLMAWPWSLLVNAALVTGAIHGGRTIVGATDPRKANALYKNPHGLSVYARELIQTVLVHHYDVGGGASTGYPEPATGGGLVLQPPAKRGSPATVFDVDEVLKTKPAYESDPASKQLLQDLGPQAGAHTPLTFDASQQGDTTAKKKETGKRYDKLRTALKKYHDNGVPKPSTHPEIVKMIAVIYPGGASKPLVSLSTWQVDAFVAALLKIDPTAKVA